MPAQSALPFAPPVFDTVEKTHRARLLYRIAATAGVGTAAYSVAVPLFRPAALVGLFFTVPTLVLIVIAAMMIRRGLLAAAMWSLILTFWIMLTLIVATTGGVGAPAMGGYILLIMAAGLLMSRRHLIAITILCLVTVLGLYLGGQQDLLAHDAFSRGMVTAILLGMGSALIFLAMESLDETYGRTRQQAAVLQESEARYRLLVEQASDGIFLTDKDGNYIEVNPSGCTLLGYTREELLALRITDLIPEDVVAREPIDYEALQGGKVVLHERPLRRKDGTLIDTEISARVLPDGRMQGIVRDITMRKQTEEALRWLNMELETRVVERTMALEREMAEREQAEEEVRQLNEDLQRRALRLESANKALESFSYSVSHDLRAPLRAISGFAEILNRRYLDALDEEGKRFLEHIIGASARMDQLIRDLLNYARLGHEAVEHLSLSLELVFEQVSRTLALQIRSCHALVDLPGEPPRVSADPVLLQQVVLNLLENALTYSRPGVRPHIRVHCEVTPSHRVLIHITDNGLGILPAYQEKIFNVFQRLHSEEEYPGTGIGLAIVKKAVGLMGGDVRVQSAEGEGSTFTVELAAVHEAPGRDPLKAPSPHERR